MARTSTRTIVRRILLILPISVLVSVAFAYFTTDAGEFRRLSSFSLPLLGLAAGLRLVPWVTKSLRLRNWMVFRGHRFSFWDGIQVTMMADLGAIATPTSVGGEPVKAGMLYQRGASLGEATSLTTVAAIEDLTVYLICMPAAFFVATGIGIKSITTITLRQVAEAWWIIAVVAGALLLIVVTLIIISAVPSLVRLRKRIRHFWRQFRRVYAHMVRSGKRIFFGNLLLTVIHWGARYSVVAALALSLGIHVEWIRLFVLQWLVFALMALIPTPGAAGGAEGVFLLLFSTVLPRAALGTIMIGWRFIDYYLVAILAIVVLGIQGVITRVRARISAERQQVAVPPLIDTNGNKP